MALFAKRDHAFENVAVLRKEEIFGAQALDGSVQRVIIQQDCAQNAAFGLDIVRKRTFDADVGAGHLDIRFIFAHYIYERKSGNRQGELALRRNYFQLLSLREVHCGEPWRAKQEMNFKIWV
jgi:hypothetical protein